MHSGAEWHLVTKRAMDWSSFLCFCWVTSLFGLMPPKKKGKQPDDDEDVAPKGKPKAKAKAKAKQAKDEEEAPKKRVTAKRGAGEALDTSKIKQFRSRITYGLNHTDPEKVADAKAAQEAYDSAPLEVKQQVLDRLEGMKNLKFVPTMVTEAYQETEDIDMGVSDRADRFEIYKHKPMPDDVMKAYCQKLKSRPHPDKALSEMGELQYWFEYRAATEHVEKDGNKRNLKAVSSNLTHKMVADAENPESSASSTKAKKDSIEVLACDDWTKLQKVAKELLKEHTACTKLISTFTMQLAGIKNQDPKSHKEFCGKIAEATKLLDGILEWVGLCKSIPPGEAQQSVEAHKSVRGYRLDIMDITDKAPYVLFFFTLLLCVKSSRGCRGCKVFSLLMCMQVKDAAEDVKEIIKSKLAIQNVQTLD